MSSGGGLGGGSNGTLQGSSKSQATSKQQQQQRGSSLATMAMRKRGYVVPFLEDDSFNFKFLQGEVYSTLCSFYGVEPVKPTTGEDNEITMARTRIMMTMTMKRMTSIMHLVMKENLDFRIKKCCDALY